MSKVPSDLRYAKSHEWVRIEGDLATIGITDHAQGELTDVVFVELPAPQRALAAGEASELVADPEQDGAAVAADLIQPLRDEARHFLALEHHFANQLVSRHCRSAMRAR